MIAEKRLVWERNNKSNKCRYFIVVCLCIFVTILLRISCINMIDSYRLKLLKPTDYWRQQTSQKSNCVKNVDEKSQSQLELIIEMFNSQKLNYFLCFSSLFLTVKLENNGVFQSQYNNSNFNELNNYYKAKNRQDCSRHDTTEALSPLAHVCLLREENFTNICGLLATSESVWSSGHSQVACSYNVWNGEYVIEIDSLIRLVVHEYESAAPDSSFMEENNLNDKARLRLGLMQYLFGAQFHAMPLYFFYAPSQQQPQQTKFFYLNYLGAPFRLPSETVNYFMIFYSDLWYIDSV